YQKNLVDQNRNLAWRSMLVIAPAVAIPHPQLFVAKRLFSSVDQWRKHRKITECMAP
ncbi:uncharacterized protein METZ01_LOCUS506942, partial [marine metagenome]